MPRTTIDISQKIEFLSILNEKAELDEALEPDIEDAELLRLHRCMMLARRFDERLLDLQRQGRIGTFPPIQGQEAAHLGAAAALRPSDWMVPAFREMAAELWRGRSLENVIIANNGIEQAGAMPVESRTLPMAIPVASQIPHAVGIAWAAKYRQTDEVVMTFFGDGATSEGDFHEALNFAGVFQVPVIFVCQNNQWAISVPLKHQTRSKTLAQKAIAYGMPGIQVDGNDLLAVYVAAREAVERARAGGGPTLIECVTYRIMMHTTADDPKRYRTEEEVAQWRVREPLARFERYLMSKGLLSEDRIADLQTEIADEIQASIARAEAHMKDLNDPLAVFNHLYADLPPYLKAQRRMFAEDSGLDDKERPHG